MLKLLPPRSGTDAYRLVGDLDENAEPALAELVQKLRGASGKRDVAITMKEIGIINSIGVQRWLSFLKSLPSDVVPVFKDCSTSFIEYASMLTSFLGNGRIASFEIPFHCDPCGRQVTRLLETAATAAAGHYGDERCERCKGKLESLLPYEELETWLKAP